MALLIGVCRTATDARRADDLATKQMTDGLQLRRPLVGHRKVVVIDVLHVTNALRPARRRCGYANARPPPSY